MIKLVVVTDKIDDLRAYLDVNYHNRFSICGDNCCKDMYVVCLVETPMIRLDELLMMKKYAGAKDISVISII